MKPLLDELLAARVTLTDGAIGTELQRRGLAAGELGETWNLAHPKRVEEIARAYVEAGSRIILTNTFRSNRITLSAHGRIASLAAFNRAGVEIALRAAAGRAYVFGSLGPTGKLLFMGETTEEELLAAFSEQARILTDAGVHGIVIETMGDLDEARLAVRAAIETGVPVAVSMVFDSGKNHDRTLMGATPEQAARDLTEAGADIVGANCGQGIDGYVPICQRLQRATDRPVWIKPNAGLPQLVEGRTVYSTSPEEFARHAPALAEAGARFLGGCCGTTPEFIRAVGGKLNRGGAENAESG